MNDNIYANIILDYINHGFSPIPIPLQDENANNQGMEQAQDYGQQL